jgi:hypothetical protein
MDQASLSPAILKTSFLKQGIQEEHQMNTPQSSYRKIFWCLFAVSIILGSLIWQVDAEAQSSRSTINSREQDLRSRTASRTVLATPALVAMQHARARLDQAISAQKANPGNQTTDDVNAAWAEYYHASAARMAEIQLSLRDLESQAKTAASAAQMAALKNEMRQIVATPLAAAPELAPVRTRYWSTAGSTGTTDEDSTTILSHDDFAAQIKDGLTGTATVRYNITATRDISSFCPATSSTVNVRFRNSDNTGTTAQVKFEIHRSNILSGGNDIIYSFNSNGLGAGSAFTSASAAPAIDFDFSTYIYWIEANIFRSSAAQFADLGDISIHENGGTPCP